MIGILGDIHGSLRALQTAARTAAARGDAALLQVGDFGWYRQTAFAVQAAEFPLPIYFIHGNHEKHDELAHLDQPTLVARNLTYVPHGSVLQIDGRRIAFLGGASSVDKAYQVRVGHWSPMEATTRADVDRLLANAGTAPIDLLVTHCPPQWVIQKHFDPMDLVRYFDLPATWRDPSADLVEEAWTALGEPPLFCGHMHRSVTDGTVRILNIEELASF